MNPQSLKLAGLFAVLIVIYFVAHSLFGGEQDKAVEVSEADKFSVIASAVQPAQWQDTVTVRGRTEAVRKVIVRAQTGGAVITTPIDQGKTVKKGDVLCELAVDGRRADVNHAQAALRKARLDFNAAKSLQNDGFRSETAVASARAALDLASATLQRAEVELNKTKIVAPFDGIFDRRDVEIGDFMRVGDPCGVIIQPDPFLVIGAVAERDVAKISIGDRGVATLATGQRVEGKVRLVATVADPATRTFNVELAVPNSDGSIRDGVTAEFTVFARSRMAHLVPRSSLTLNDAGQIGLRTVSPEDIVEFRPISLIGENADGVWVDGVEGDIRLITRGHEYVKAGQDIIAVSRESAAKKANAP